VDEQLGVSAGGELLEDMDEELGFIVDTPVSGVESDTPPSTFPASESVLVIVTTFPMESMEGN